MVFLSPFEAHRIMQLLLEKKVQAHQNISLHPILLANKPPLFCLQLAWIGYCRPLAITLSEIYGSLTIIVAIYSTGLWSSPHHQLFGHDLTKVEGIHESVGISSILVSLPYNNGR
jgi:hypothetical protein